VVANCTIGVITTLEFLQHHFSEMGHRNLLVTPPYSSFFQISKPRRPWYDWLVDSFECAECRAIYEELREAYRAVAQGTDEQNAPRDLANWVQQINEEECARMRETSDLWNLWRRLQRHRTLTGHMLSELPVPPNALSNPN